MKIVFLLVFFTSLFSCEVETFRGSERRTTFELSDYPSDWDNVYLKDMFSLLNKDKNYSAEYLKQWMSAMYICFENFDQDRQNFAALDYARTLFTLAQYVRNRYQRMEMHSLQGVDIDGFIKTWRQRAWIYLDYFNAIDLSTVIYSLAILNFPLENALLRKAEKRFEKLSQHAKIQDFTLFSWGMAVLGYRTSKVFDKKIADVTSKDRLIGKARMHQLYLAYQFFGRECPVFVKHELFQNEENDVSVAERAFFELASRSIKRSVYFRCIGSYVDGYHPDRRTVFYVDGSQHYDVMGRLHLSDALLNRILALNGFEVVRVKVPKNGFTGDEPGMEDVPLDVHALKEMRARRAPKGVLRVCGK